MFCECILSVCGGGGVRVYVKFEYLVFVRHFCVCFAMIDNMYG